MFRSQKFRKKATSRSLHRRQRKNALAKGAKDKRGKEETHLAYQMIPLYDLTLTMPPYLPLSNFPVNKLYTEYAEKIKRRPKEPVE